MIIKPEGEGFVVEFYVEGVKKSITGKSRRECINSAIDEIRKVKEVDETVETEYSMYINKRALSTEYRNNLSDIKVYLDSDHDAKSLMRILIDNRRELTTTKTKLKKLNRDMDAIAIILYNLTSYVFDKKGIDDQIERNPLDLVSQLSEIIYKD